MRSLRENAHLFRQCRSQLRTMIFDFHSCCFIDHLHCCLSSRAHLIHSLIHHIFIPRALFPRTTLLPSYPRNLTPIALTNPSSRISSKSTFIPVSPYPRYCFRCLLLIILLAFLFFALIPPSFVSTSTLAGSFFFISNILYLPIMLLHGY
jgi:hypothetical protein